MIQIEDIVMKTVRWPNWVLCVYMRDYFGVYWNEFIDLEVFFQDDIYNRGICAVA